MIKHLLYHNSASYPRNFVTVKMQKIANIHNKTQAADVEEMPFNNRNILIQEADLREIFDKNGLADVKINDIDLYRNAFVHKSYCTMKNADFTSGNLKKPDDCLPLQEMSYERAELIGDALLSAVCSVYLAMRFPDQNEGFLSKMRTKLVNGKMLGYLGQQLGFQKFVIISKQVEDANGRNNYKIVEDVFEAFIAALYTDHNDEGFHICQRWIIHIFENYLDFSELILQKTNYKDMLVLHMAHLQDQPRFYEVNVMTKDSTKVFTYCVKDKNNTVIATAKGPTKKDAENNVALEALKHYGVSL